VKKHDLKRQNNFDCATIEKQLNDRAISTMMMMQITFTDS
jgi:hypothetical protein